MTSTKSSDGPEDVNDFLLRIRELGERRDKEDDERTKRLEDEIMQGRKERQARRAERARSIAGSPTLNPLRLSVSSIGQPSIEPPEHLEPTVQTADPEPVSGAKSSQESETLYTADSRRGSVQDIGSESPRSLPPLSRSRTGTLSWQQRPSSRELGNRSPGSTSPTRSSHLRTTSSASNDNQPSRASVAFPLSSKEPSWFRQTPDLGVSSPVYRKPEDEPESQVEQDTSNQIPEISDESAAEPAEPEKVERPEERSPSPPPTASTVGDSNFSNRYSSVSSVSPPPGLRSPEQVTEAPKLDPRQTDSFEEPMLPPSPTQRRMSPERARSTSPTKGLGGFVQSAMMRRSDSVSKRWSAQIPQGRLSRSNSIVSNRNSVAAPSFTASFKRPSSSYSDASVQPSEITERPTTPSFSGNDTMRSEGSPTRPSAYGHSRSASSVTVDSMGGDGPGSPFTSRTMDPRRWSPTKATWLESALNRPESRQQKPPPPQPPAWAQARQSRGSVDMGRASPFKEVTPVGLMRTPPPGGHFKKPSLSGTPSALGSPTAAKKAYLPDTSLVASEPESELAKTVQESESEPERKLSTVETVEPVEPVETLEDESSPMVILEDPSPKSRGKPSLQLEKVPKPDSVRKLPLMSPRTNFSLPTREPLHRPKPQSPVVDFRANLRKREVVQDKEKTQEPEFKNMFGKLKKTETRNFVAQDELKGNILRGKAALNATGGPKKSDRVDEFKESLVTQKAAMKAGGGSIRRNTVGEKDEPPKPVEAIPEAIAKRNLMTKTPSIRRPNTDITSPTVPAPELSPSRVSQTSRELAPVSPIITKEEIPWELPRDSFQESFPFPASSELKPVDKEPESTSIPVLNQKDDVLETITPVVEPEQEEASNDVASPVRSLPSPPVAEAASPVLAAKGKLAGRINPALAGLLSRGPPVAAEGPKKELPSPSAGDSSPASPSTPLTHMTKSRARGPKRRAPKGASAPAVEAAEDITEVGAISSPEARSFQTTPEPVASPKPTSVNVSNEKVVLDTETAQTGSPYIRTLQGVKTSFQNALNNGLSQKLRNLSPTSPREFTTSGSQLDKSPPERHDPNKRNQPLE
ncbi:uncharacterized protein N7483_006662 [Penicillium malachiteum]|uniref:uncharacterized protein n=1 Tax=Penicillium malachiteum TaxID=1324776 RepID=UPI002547B1C1|nr:uncharacterized protein N7483_006662 [Penicillium malachiteum]KAJ5725305.1 hypothetical protein N7483_006662 [Penicillium malachiteum]